MRHLYYILCFVLLTCVGCQFKLSSDDENDSSQLLEIDRYDRLEYRYLTTGDFSALQQMNTEYPIETRTLIEDVVKIGEITDPDINTKFLKVLSRYHIAVSDCCCGIRVCQYGRP